MNYEEVSRNSPFLSCMECEKGVHEESLDSEGYCEDCSPYCENCNERSHEYLMWKNMIICEYCWESIETCEICQIESLDIIYNDDYEFICPKCNENN